MLSVNNRYIYDPALVFSIFRLRLWLLSGVWGTEQQGRRHGNERLGRHAGGGLGADADLDICDTFYIV